MITSITGNSPVHTAFLNVLSKSDVVDVPYSETWNNGTGYFDALVHIKLDLPVGSRFKSITPGGNNRKILGIVTPLGNAVFFERYTAGESGVITSNVPRQLTCIVPSGSCEVDVFQRATMFESLNIGTQVAAIIAAACAPDTDELDSEEILPDSQVK